MVRVFQGFQKEKSLRHLAAGIEVGKAQDYYPDQNDPDYAVKNDAPWIRRFAAAGGKLVISSDTKMRRRSHERFALVQTNLVVVFFTSQWSGSKFCRKCSLLMHWWPIILEAVTKAAPGFYIVSMAWPEEGKAELREVPSIDLKLEKIKRQKAMGDEVRKGRTKRREPSSKQGELFK